MKNINNYHQKLKNKGKQKTQLTPKAEIANMGKWSQGADRLRGPGGRGFALLAWRCPHSLGKSQGQGDSSPGQTS